MLTQSNTSKKIKSSKPELNKADYEINRGFEFILSGGKRKQQRPIHIVIEKVLTFFKREVNIYFQFSLSTRKKN